MTTVIGRTLTCACVAMLAIFHPGPADAQATRTFSPASCSSVFNGSGYGNLTHAKIPGTGFVNYSGSNMYVACPIVNDEYLNFPLLGVSMFVHNPVAPLGQVATSVTCWLYQSREMGQVVSQIAGTVSQSGKGEIYLALNTLRGGVYEVMCLLPNNGKILSYYAYY
jgi:hypothetical protein